MTDTNTIQTSDINRALEIDQSIGRAQNLKRWFAWVAQVLIIMIDIILWQLMDTTNSLQYKTLGTTGRN